MKGSGSMLLGMFYGLMNYLSSIKWEVKIALFIAVAVCILLCIYYRFVYSRQRVELPKETNDFTHILGPKEWEKQMIDLSVTHKNVARMQYNFVLADRNKLAHKKLNRIRNTISEISSDIIALIPAARWLFDNYQIMYREIKKENTLDTSYERLPILRTKKYWGYPRVYMVAKKMVAIARGHLDAENISIMLHAYQKETPLLDEELDVLPGIIGFCLLEQIMEVADDIIRIIKIKSKADQFVKDKISIRNGEMDVSALFCETDADCKENYSFHSQVIYLLRNMSFSKAAILKYTEYHYSSDNKYQKPANIFVEEGKLESYLESNIHGLIDSLRGINEVDEQSLFEELSYIESVLLKDPAGVYPEMESVSRAMYRSEIIKLSKKYNIKEENIVRDCLQLAIDGRDDLINSNHVGTYLLGKGYPSLRNKIRNKKQPENLQKIKFKNLGKKTKGIAYFLLLFVFFAAFYFAMYFFMRDVGNLKGKYIFGLFFVIAFPVLLGLALEITNRIFTRGMPIRKIPSLDYQKSIPDSARTFLVMPVLISSEKQCRDYLERLERHYLANKQENLYFALLIDFEDSLQKNNPKDEIFKTILIKRMNNLNNKYSFKHLKFALFIRDRKWNESENCYMGWERKRGKLEEFNKLIYGAKKEDTTYSTFLCDERLLETFKYVITLDADSNLIRDNASKLVGIIDHPLNQPVIDYATGKLKEGYAIIQPSVRNHIIDNRNSRFSNIFGCECGVSNYSFVISDIYQDIFNEGVYVGKGIYHVQAFHQILHDAIPENKVLSHDLLESCYVRTAFASAVKILDVFPKNILSYINREQRWIRGDWQLLPWLFKSKNVNGVSKWKMFDNLRRSMEPFSKTVFLILNLIFIPKIFYLGFLFVFFSDVLNLIYLFFTIVSGKIKKPRLTIIYKKLWKEVLERFERAILGVIFLPFRAYTATDSILRTIYRMTISKKNLLMWSASETVEKTVTNTKKGYLYKMWSSFIPAVILLVSIYFANISILGMVTNILLAIGWGFSFMFAYFIRMPRIKSENNQDEENRELLMETARRTWEFFKEFSREEYGWLCPDNYQVVPQKKISNKTSPTNIGLQFLTILSARDFGFETLSETVKQVSNLLETVVKLPKWKGHLYNWYNIHTLEVLNPAYISTVDSGNFFGHIIALKNGMVEQIDLPLLSNKRIEEFKALIQNVDDISSLKNDYATFGEMEIDLEKIKYELIRQKENIENYEKTLIVLNQILAEIQLFKLANCSYSSCATLRQLSNNGNLNATALISQIKSIRNTINDLLDGASFSCLFNDKRKLFYIGYHVSSETMDAGCYDLMASEALLTSYLAIARGDVPEKHWTKLGRLLTMVKGIPCFVSWSGTMFEYLMPKLVMQEYGGTVFANTSKAAVLQQIKYAKQKKIPWGISESQYYRFDLDSNYQYKAFGVPKIRLKPSFKESLVVTPYATMLALSYAEKSAFSNLRKLVELGVFGMYGFYEAVDFDTNDPDMLIDYSIIKSFMAHHQGMTFVSINNYLNKGIMRTRFHKESIVKATESLLEEKLDSNFILIARKGYTIKTRKEEYKDEILSNRYVNSTAPILPVANYLCNNRYSIMTTSDGDGFSKYMNRMIYRWRPDRYAFSGNYIYIKDVSENKVWSVTYHPTKVEPDTYQAIFLPHQSEYKRTDGNIFSHTTVSLAISHDIEIRKVTLNNRGKIGKEIQLTSYLEVVGDTYLAELSHPAFNKLFIESEFLEEESIFLSKRRNQNGMDKPYVMHMVKSGDTFIKKVEYENDRLKFIGRNNTLSNPDALQSESLSNNAGFSNDPIMSMRVSLFIKEGETVSVSFITGVCKDKEQAIQISEELSDPYRINDTFDQFRRQSEMELKYLEITRPQHNAFQDLVSPIYYPTSYYRGPAENIRKNWKNQSFLWKFGVSGDIPIMLLKVKSIEEEGIIKDVLKAYEYLRVNRMKIDLIILNESKYGYMEDLNDFLNEMISTLKIYDESREKKSLFIINSYQLIPAEMDLLYTVAMVVFSEETGIYFRSIKENLGDTIEE